MANKDLRDWIASVEKTGELKVIKGAETKEEIGGFVDIYMRKMGQPAVMFDEIPGYPKGHRVVAQHPDVGSAHQSCARLAAGNHRDGADPVVAHATSRTRRRIRSRR